MNPWIRPFVPAPRVLLYSHDSFGLGHYRRSSNIVHAIAGLCPEVQMLCLTGSPRPDMFPLPAGADYVKLPSATKDDDGNYVSRDLSASLQELVELRASAVLTVCESFQPDVVLVDHTPLGLEGELLPTLRLLRDRFPETRTVLGLRDILDSPDRSRRELRSSGAEAAMRELYETILVYGQRDVFDLEQEYALPSLRDRLEYTGYVAQQMTSPGEEDPGSIVVTAGGGADGRPVVDAVLAAAPHLDPDQRITFLAGPLMSRREVRELRRRARELPQAEFHASTHKVPRLLGRAELVIGMGGYNSVVESVAAGRRLLVVPRTSPRREQWERARRFAARGVLRMVEPEVAAVPQAMAQAIRDAQAWSPRPATAAGLQLDGAEAAARVVLELASSSRWPVAGPEVGNL